MRVHKYKVGDIVTVVDNRYGHGFAMGELIEIKWLSNFNEDYYAEDGKGKGYYVTDQELNECDAALAEPDMVNSPAHYGNGSIECIEYIEDFLTTEEFIGYLRGNIAKYLHRFRYKNGLEDLKKAEWYLNRLSEVMEDEECSKF